MSWPSFCRFPAYANCGLLGLRVNDVVLVEDEVYTISKHVDGFMELFVVDGNVDILDVTRTLLFVVHIVSRNDSNDIVIVKFFFVIFLGGDC